MIGSIVLALLGIMGTMKAMESQTAAGIAGNGAGDSQVYETSQDVSE